MDTMFAHSLPEVHSKAFLDLPKPWKPYPGMPSGSAVQRPCRSKGPVIHYKEEGSKQ